MGIEYWLSRLEDRWGRPRNGINLLLITDSQASIEIMENVAHLSGIKDTLRSEMDVALELHQQRTNHSWVCRQVCKVESHIDILDAPDEFMWECNNFVDEMATKARSEFRLQDLQSQSPVLFPGVKAGCQISGSMINNSLYKALKMHINGSALRMYSMEKYNWTEKMFSYIHWRAHHTALLKFPRQQRVTLGKYIFGWLATKRRRHRERQSPTDKCALCGLMEGRMHLFKCQHTQVTQLRNIAWTKLTMDIICHTADNFKAIFLSGMQILLGGAVPSIELRQEWPEHFQTAFQARIDIGWDQLLFGRIAHHWDKLAQYSPGPAIEPRPGVWTTRAIRLVWQFGLEMWTICNQIVHGTMGGTSILEQERVSSLVSLIYRDLPSIISQRVDEVIWIDWKQLSLTVRINVRWHGWA